MDTMDAINILKKHNLYEKAESECEAKFDRGPYDMRGHHYIYCQYLSNKYSYLKNEVTKLKKIKCVEWSNIQEELKPIHDECVFAIMSLEDIYCKTKCNLYNKIREKTNDMEEILKAKEVLKNVAQSDFNLR